MTTRGREGASRLYVVGQFHYDYLYGGCIWLQLFDRPCSGILTFPNLFEGSGSHVKKGFQPVVHSLTQLTAFALHLIHGSCDDVVRLLLELVYFVVDHFAQFADAILLDSIDVDFVVGNDVFKVTVSLIPEAVGLVVCLIEDSREVLLG